MKEIDKHQNHTINYSFFFAVYISCPDKNDVDWDLEAREAALGPNTGLGRMGRCLEGLLARLTPVKGSPGSLIVECFVSIG